MKLSCKKLHELQSLEEMRANKKCNKLKIKSITFIPINSSFPLKTAFRLILPGGKVAE